MKRILTIVGGTISIVVLCLLLLGHIVAFMTDVSLRQWGIATQGTITDLSSVDCGGDQAAFTRVTVQYTDAQGTEYVESTDLCDPSSRTYSIGEHIQIVYLPSDPVAFKPRDYLEGGGWGWDLAFFCFALVVASVLLISGAVSVIKLLRYRRRAMTTKQWVSIGICGFSVFLFVVSLPVSPGWAWVLLLIGGTIGGVVYAAAYGEKHAGKVHPPALPAQTPAPTAAPKTTRKRGSFIESILCRMGIHQGEWTKEGCHQSRFCIFCGASQHREKHNWPANVVGGALFAEYFKDGSCEMRMKCYNCGKTKSIGIRHEGRTSWWDSTCKRCGQDLSGD